MITLQILSDKPGFYSIQSDKHNIQTSSTIVIKSKTPFRIKVNGESGGVYSGSLFIRCIGSRFIIINDLDFDDYIAGVVKGEMPFGSGEALAAQAITARSFALANFNRHKNEGFNWCDSTHCQYFQGYTGNDSKYYIASRTTKGMVLFAEGRIVESFYHSTCGGATSNAVDVYSQYIPGISGIWDKTSVKSNALCSNSPHFRWNYKLTKNELNAIIEKEKSLAHIGSIKNIIITKKDAFGRIIFVRLEGGKGHAVLSGYDFWQILGSRLGWGKVESAAFSVKEDNNSYLIQGKGLGHGLGLCQYGAVRLAALRWKYRDILKHYFPKAQIIRLPEK